MDDLLAMNGESGGGRGGSSSSSNGGSSGSSSSSSSSGGGSSNHDTFCLCLECGDPEFQQVLQEFLTETPTDTQRNKRGHSSAFLEQPGATPRSGERNEKRSRTDMRHRSPTVVSSSVLQSTEECDATSKLHNELDAFSGLDVDMSKKKFDSLAKRIQRVKFPPCCCTLFESGHHASDPCACPNPKKYKTKSGTRCGVEPFNRLVPRLKKDGTVGQDEERWNPADNQGKKKSLPQVQLPRPAQAACGTGGCQNFFYAFKLIVGFLQLKGGCANKSGKDLQMKDHEGRIIFFSEQNFMRAKKALVVIGLTSDDWINWAGDSVPGFVKRLGGREAVRGYMRELFSSSASFFAASSASSVAEHATAAAAAAKNDINKLLASVPNLTCQEARRIFQSVLDEALDEHFCLGASRESDTV